MVQVNGKCDPLRVLAPSGVAALNIGGATIHSGLHIPIGEFSELSGSSLASLQVDWEDIHFLVVGEKSMVRLKLLAKIDSRCRQIRPAQADSFSGELCVGLVSNFAQLPLVGDTPSYAPALAGLTDNTIMSQEGHLAYRQFTHSFSLKVHCQQGKSEEQKQFRSLLRRASGGTLTIADWEVLVNRCDCNLPEEEK
jgi:hypothetical protein